MSKGYKCEIALYVKRDRKQGYDCSFLIVLPAFKVMQIIKIIHAHFHVLIIHGKIFNPSPFSYILLRHYLTRMYFCYNLSQFLTKRTYKTLFTKH